ncbi:Aspartic endopeptidase [Sarracenia purpurea var. burkii]
MHRDSPQSPFYNPSATKLERMQNAFQRSFSRAARFQRSYKSPALGGTQSQILSANGEYIMKLSIGTPPVSVLGIADTGSDLIWTQCKPCSGCYWQTSPLFDPMNSSTYRKLSCQSRMCQAVGTSTCTDQNVCQYSITYGDQSFSLGDLGVETFTFGSTSSHVVPIPKMVFGCGHNNEGSFDGIAAGVIGLGGGSLSLVNQLGDSKFSYCLTSFDPDSNVTSKINFGEEAVVSGAGVVSTPIVKKKGPDSTDTFYYLTLESIIVGGNILAYKQSSGIESAGDVEEGNIIIDSGTTLTLLPSDLYENLKSELKQVINGEPVDDPSGILGLCYNDTNINLPTMMFKFAGAELEVPSTGTFVKDGDLVCLAMLPSSSVAIFGNLCQMNFLIGYDLRKGEVSFMPTDCSKHQRVV